MAFDTAVDTGLSISAVLSTLPRPKVVLSNPVGIPVNTGLSLLIKLDSAAKALSLSARIAAAVAVDTGLFKSEVLSTSDKPIIAFVTPVTVPVNIGLANGASRDSTVCALVISAVIAACVAVEIGLLASEVLSTSDNPTIAFVIPLIVPVKVGLAIGALVFKVVTISAIDKELSFKYPVNCIMLAINPGVSRLISLNITSTSDLV